MSLWLSNSQGGGGGFPLECLPTVVSTCASTIVWINKNIMGSKHILDNTSQGSFRATLEFLTLST